MKLPAKLEARRARRAAQRDGLRNLARFFRALPLLWAERRRGALHRVMRGTIPLFGTTRISLSLFSEPGFFLRHLLRQDHPAHHRPLLLALPLEARAFWPGDAFARTLQENVEPIAAEYGRIAPDIFRHPNSVLLVEAGTWSVFPLFKGGLRHEPHCEACPHTARLIESLPHCAEGADGLGQITFSVLDPGSHLRPHSGSVNVRLRYHLGLETPQGPWLRVGTERREWARGKVLIFDDSLEHEVRHEGAERRVVLLVDLWHPELTQEERAFTHALATRLFASAPE